MNLLVPEVIKENKLYTNWNIFESKYGERIKILLEDLQTYVSMYSICHI
jgi:hypothetical protein